MIDLSLIFLIFKFFQVASIKMKKQTFLRQKVIFFQPFYTVLELKTTSTYKSLKAT